MTYIPDILKTYRSGEKLAMVTAYDYTMASLMDAAGADMLLVGDSLANVVQGRENTLTVTVEQMIYHAEMVARGTKNALVVCDMPFMSYEVDEKQALREAGKIIKESGVNAVKLEGGEEIAKTVERIVQAGIPLMGHLGLLPQSVHQTGFKVQGKSDEDAKELISDAKILEAAGAFAIVLEKVPSEIAKTLTEEINIPTIGIGAGPDCSGQVLVGNDILGLHPEGVDFRPRFIKKYASLQETILEAGKNFVTEVKSGKFPDKENSY